MTHFNEEIARLFFEIKGFLVRTNIPLPVGKGSPDSDIDLAVVNIRPAGGLPRKVLLDLEGVTHLRRAIVEVKGYHTERFSPSIFDVHKMFRFASTNAHEVASGLFNGQAYRRVFVLSRLPVSADARNRTFDLVRKSGVDHIIEFQTVLDAIIEHVRPEPDYDSAFLQSVRLLKNYGYVVERGKRVSP